MGFCCLADIVIRIDIANSTVNSDCIHIVFSRSIQLYNASRDDSLRNCWTSRVPSPPVVLGRCCEVTKEVCSLRPETATLAACQTPSACGISLLHSGGEVTCLGAWGFLPKTFAKVDCSVIAAPCRGDLAVQARTVQIMARYPRQARV